MKLIASFAAMMVASTYAASLTADAEQYYGASRQQYGVQGNPQHYGRVQDEYQRRLGAQRSNDQNRYQQQQKIQNQRNSINAYNNAYALPRQQQASKIVGNHLGNQYGASQQQSSYGQKPSYGQVQNQSSYYNSGRPSRPQTSYNQKPSYGNGGRPAAPQKNTFGGYGNSIKQSTPNNAYGQNSYQQQQPVRSYGGQSYNQRVATPAYGQKNTYGGYAAPAQQSSYGASNQYAPKPAQNSFNSNYLNRVGSQQKQTPQYGIQQPNQYAVQQPVYGSGYNNQGIPTPSYAPQVAPQPIQHGSGYNNQGIPTPAYAPQIAPQPIQHGSGYNNQGIPTPSVAPQTASYPAVTGPPKGFGFKNDQHSDAFNAGWQPPTDLENENPGFGSKKQYGDKPAGGNPFGSFGAGGFEGFANLGDDDEDDYAQEAPQSLGSGFEGFANLGEDDEGDYVEDIDLDLDLDYGLEDDLDLDDGLEDDLDYGLEDDAEIDAELDPYSREALLEREYVDPSRNPYTGQYWGRAPREARTERPKYDRGARDGGYAGREARAQRTPYVPKQSQSDAILESVAPVSAVQDHFVMPEANTDGYSADPWDSIDKSVFEVPDMEHPDHTPGNRSENHAFALGAPQGALAIQGEKNPYKDVPEGEEAEEEEDENPVLEKEPYMTKDYYLPGYVDPTPPKEYPPALRQFKNYIETIGDFDKHSFEKEDYSVDGSFAPDSSGFGPDSSGFAPNTGSFSQAGQSYKPQYDAFTPVNSYGGYKPAASDYGNYKPSVLSQGGFRPAGQSFGNYQPTASDYGNYKPSQLSSGSFRPAASDYGQYKPSQLSSGSFKPAASDYGNYKPQQLSQGNFRPAVGNYGGYNSGAAYGGNPTY